MKIFFCVKNSSIESLKDKPSIHKMSKIITKFSKPKTIARREFSSISNIEYLDISVDLRLAELYDKLMDRELFEASFVDLDHHKVFEEYKKFNEDFANNIKESVEPDDLFIINDSSLFLLPGLLNARFAFRNLRFDGCFIEKVPFYKEIIKNLCKSQKFFENKESLDSFNMYIMSSYEMKDVEKGGCWYLKPYVDKFAIIDTLEHILELLQRKSRGLLTLESKTLSKRFDNRLMRYLYEFPIPKLIKRILIDVNLTHLEPFIKKHPYVQIRYLRTGVEFNDDASKMIQYLKKMYVTNLSIADTTEYSEIVSEMFYCDVFVGSQYKEIAQLFGKPVVEEVYDPMILSEEVEKALFKKVVNKYDVIGEDEYLKEFMSVNGYEAVIDYSANENETIDRLSNLINTCVSPNNTSLVHYKKINNMGEEEIYIKRNEKMEEGEKESYYPILSGENRYSELKKKRNLTVPPELNKEETIKYWESSNKTMLLDYDGTLTHIVNDPDKATLKDKTKDILIKLSRTCRVVICTGRPQKNMDEWIPPEIEVYAEHGAFHRVNGTWSSQGKKSDRFDMAKEIMQYYHIRTPGTAMEEKAMGLCFHYRMAPDFCVDKLYTLLRKIEGENVQLGKKIIELKGSNKGKTCKVVDPAICVGDDITDEDMFKVCKGLTIKIGEDKSIAKCHIKSVDEFIDFLEKLIE